MEATDSTSDPEVPVEPSGIGFDQFAKAAAALIAIAATVSYAFLRIAYVQFYSRAGIDPEDVGIGRTELLSQAVSGPLVIILFWTAYLLLLLWLGWALFHAVRTRSIAGGKIVPSAKRAGWAVGLVFTVVVAGTTGFLYQNAVELGEELEVGDAARLSYIRPLGLIKIPILEIWALPVEIDWPDPSTRPGVLADGTECMLYLGESDGIGVLYDVTQQRSILFVREHAVVTISQFNLDGPETLDEGCLPESGSS